MERDWISPIARIGAAFAAQESGLDVGDSDSAASNAIENNYLNHIENNELKTLKNHVAKMMHKLVKE